MDRRRFTRAVVGGAVVPVAALAGCSHERTVRDYIDEAAALIEANNDTFATLDLDIGEGRREPSFDADVVHGRVDDAFELLDAAEDLGPTDGEREQIEALRQLGAAQLAMADFVEQLLAVVSQFQTVRNYVGEGELQQALDELLDLETAIADAETALDEVETAFEAIDREPFDEEDRDGLTEGERQVALLSDRLAGLALLVEGFVPFIRGNIAWHDGSDRYIESDYEAAIDRYETALSDLTEAKELFDDGDESPPSDEIDYERFACITDNLLDVVGYLQGSAEARLDGDDEEAEQLWEQGTGLLETGDC